MLSHYSGHIAVLEIANRREDPTAVGKPRPGLLLHPVGDSCWQAVGFTSQSTYKTTGKPRIAVFASARNGLRHDGFLWSPHPVTIPEAAIGKIIGVVDEHVAEVIAQNVDIDEITARRLRVIARDPWPRAA